MICKNCVMDESDPDIVFDEDGVCNHCKDFFEKERTYLANNQGKLPEIISNIKKFVPGTKYNAILGISGGVDSSFVAYLAKKEGLNVLLTHLDNGFDDPRGIMNVKQIIAHTGWDYEPFTMDFSEYCNIWKAYLKASVIDVEAPTDHAITASIYKLANKHHIKHILTGSNLWTELIMPLKWGYRWNDLSNLKAICREQDVKLKTFPKCGLQNVLWNRIVRKIKRVPFLDYVDYNVAESKKLLTKEWDWQDYGPKHHESVLTRFYQTYILPVKFGVDKRKAHFSNLICSGQLSRDEALLMLKDPPLDRIQIESDMDFVLGKLGLSREAFSLIMLLPPRSHYEFATDDWMYNLLKFAKKMTGIANV